MDLSWERRVKPQLLYFIVTHDSSSSSCAAAAREDQDCNHSLQPPHTGLGRSRWKAWKHIIA
eukprot:15478904-Alexandrium_andersonii.AAC.1